MYSMQEAFDGHFKSKHNFSEFLNASASTDSDSLKFSERVVYQPREPFKAFLRFLNQYVFSYAETVSEVVYSYRLNTSIKDSLLKHQASRFFYKTDLKCFFESIVAADVRSILENKMTDCPISDLSQYQDLILNMVLVEGRLPVGFPTSPLISNSVLYEFDCQMLAWCNKNKITYTRYSDDLIFSSGDLGHLKKAPDLVQQALTKKYEGKLKVNLEKSYFIPRRQKTKLLGLVILQNGQITVSRILKNKIETSLHFYLEDRNVFRDVVDTKFGSAASFTSYLRWVASIDGNYIDKLRAKYGNFVVDLFLH